MEIEIRKSNIANLAKYISLHNATYPKVNTLTFDYLSWLYGDNPVGQAVGADAWNGNEVVGQVIAIPGIFNFHDKLVKGLVAVNVAVNPSFQGRFLFKKLGLQMCNYGAEDGYEFVIGVANAAATPGWVRQMKFQRVAPLDAMVGFGDLSLKNKEFDIIPKTELIHSWEMNTLNWRLNNPLKKSCLKIVGESGWAVAYTATKNKFGISAFTEFPFNVDEGKYIERCRLQILRPRVFLGLIPNYKWGSRYYKIPEQMKPSPLNLVYKSLTGSFKKINPDTCFINYLDFDAF